VKLKPSPSTSAPAPRGRGREVIVGDEAMTHAAVTREQCVEAAERLATMCAADGGSGGEKGRATRGRDVQGGNSPSHPRVSGWPSRPRLRHNEDVFSLGAVLAATAAMDAVDLGRRASHSPASMTSSRSAARPSSSSSGWQRTSYSSG
jgi:hypothetical protein